MSISDLHHPGASPTALLGDALASVREVAGVFFAARSDDELVATIELVEQARAALAAVQAGAVAEVDARHLAQQRLRYASTAAWLTHLGGLRKPDGRRLVRRAHGLIGPLAATREALVAGRVSPERADVVVTSIDELPSGEASAATAPDPASPSPSDSTP